MNMSTSAQRKVILDKETEFMKDYLNLWVQFFQGLLALILAIFLPFIWLALELLPWGVTALITGNRLRPGYRYLYFCPRFIKELTKPLRN